MATRFPLSPRIRCLRHTVEKLEKLEPPVPMAEALLAPKPPVEPSDARRRRR